MNQAVERTQRRSSQRTRPVSFLCPTCKASLEIDSKWCPVCNFTGGDTIGMFSNSPPPLLPLLDAVGIWNPSEVNKIETSRIHLSRRFPQFKWRVCCVKLPPNTDLSVFGFWLLNVCPLHDKETSEERAWTVMLLIDVESCQAAAIPGYAAEACLGDDQWRESLHAMAIPWKSGKTADAVVAFFKTCRKQLDEFWKRHGARSPNK